MIPIWRPIFEYAKPPIYFQVQPYRSLFYAPGWLVVVPRGMTLDFEAAIKGHAQVDWPEAIELRCRAIVVQETWESMQKETFTPLCLTIYLSNVCNLNCVYCFSRPSRGKHETFSLEAACTAARVVAQNCRTQRKPMTVVFHGGGEPTANYHLLKQALGMVEEVATDFKLDLFRYIATNGVLSRNRALDLANSFDLIGLSCDGPPVIQDEQRPIGREVRRKTSWFVERTAQIIHRLSKPLHVRVTITPQTIDRQVEIAEYICETLRPEEIHVEPVYTIDGNEILNTFQSNQAETYLTSFLQARDVAKRYGIRWLTSGSRPSEIHSAYCHIWRNVLNITPEGMATACFKVSDSVNVSEQEVDLGSWNPELGQFILTPGRVSSLYQKIQDGNTDCARCFNRYHCARQCPDICVLRSGTPADSFRCRLQSMLANSLIQEVADTLCRNSVLNRPIGGKIPA